MDVDPGSENELVRPFIISGTISRILTTKTLNKSLQFALSGNRLHMFGKVIWIPEIVFLFRINNVI